MALNEAPLGPEDLITTAADGDALAFAEIVRRERMRLITTARAILLDRHEAEDVAQEALVAAWRHLPTLREHASFRPWLLRILTRIALRRRGRPRPRLLNGDLRRLAARTDNADPLVPALVREVSRLPDRDRVPVSLHYLGGLSLKEVAEATDSTEKAVKSRLHRIRTRLRRRLRREGL